VKAAAWIPDAQQTAKRPANRGKKEALWKDSIGKATSPLISCQLQWDAFSAQHTVLEPRLEEQEH